TVDLRPVGAVGVSAVRRGPRALRAGVPVTVCRQDGEAQAATDRIATAGDPRHRGLEILACAPQGVVQWRAIAALGAVQVLEPLLAVLALEQSVVDPRRDGISRAGVSPR